MGTLTLNDGTVLENSHAVFSRDLFLYIRGLTMAEAFELLIAPEKVEKITFTQINGDEVVYEGFTKLTAVRDEDNGLVTAVLQKVVE